MNFWKSCGSLGVWIILNTETTSRECNRKITRAKKPSFTARKEYKNGFNAFNTIGELDNGWLVMGDTFGELIFFGVQHACNLYIQLEFDGKY